MYGDGSDGALNVTSGTTNLNLDQKYEYTTVNVSAGAKLSTSSSSGSVLYILATTSITIDGIIDLSNILPYGDNSWSVTIDGDTYYNPGVEAGGNSGSGQSQNNGFGAGGAGGGRSSTGGAGGAGSSSGGTGGAARSVTVTVSGSSVGSGGLAGGGSAGGSGDAWASKSSSGDPNPTTTSGAGGNSYGSNGGNATGADLGSFNRINSGGGGGAGGRAGRPGVHLVLKAPIVTINGEIFTAGTDGTGAGNGGSAYNNKGSSTSMGTLARDGYGGGGGGGGNGGNITIITDDFSGITEHYAGGGAEGSGGSGYAAGSNGTAGVAGVFTLEAPGLFSNGYEFRKPLTIDHTKVGSFTGRYRVLVKHTDADLKSVANGGKVHLNPLLDIRFEDDSGNKLAHEIVTYDETTGDIQAWVRLNSLGNVSDTVFWLYYGKDLEASSYQGIKVGYEAATAMVLERNYYDGAENQGEVTPWISGMTDPDGGSITQPDNGAVAAREDGNLQTGWIMYTATSAQTRFGSEAGWNDHLVPVIYIDGVWYYDNNLTFVAFTPASTDFLIAEASWGNSTAGGRAFNYIGRRPAGEEIPWMVWAEDVAVTENIGIVSNNFREVNHLGEIPFVGYSQPSVDRFGMNFTTFGGMTSSNVVDGKVGKALDFNGSSQFLRAKKDVIWHVSSVGYISMWFKTDSVAGNSCLFSRRTGVNTGDAVSLFLLSGALRVDFGPGSQWTTGWTASAGVWYHLVAQTDGTTRRLYINGTQVASTSGGGWSTGGDYHHVQIGASISDATNSGNFYDGIIDEFRLYAEAREAGFHLTEYNNQNSPGTFYSVGDAQSILSPASANHAHTADSVTLSEHSELTVNESLHGHTVDSVVLVEDYQMTVADTLHGHMVDAIVLSVPYPTPDDTLHNHTVDNVVLTEHKTVVINDTAHGHTVDGVILTEHIDLTVDGTYHQHTVDNVGVTQEGSLGVQDTLHSLSSDNIVITQFNNLHLQDALHGHTVDNINIVENIDLVVNDTLHGHTVDGSLVLPQDYHLGIADTLHSHTSDGVTLLEKYVIQVQESTHAHTADTVQVSTGVDLSNVENARHVHSAENVVLTQKHTIQTANTRHKLLIEALQRIIDWTAMGVGFGGYLKFYKSVGQIDEAEPNDSGQYIGKFKSTGVINSTQVDESDTYKESHKETGNYY